MGTSYNIAAGGSIANRSRPANLKHPPAKPLIAPTGSPGVNNVIDVINATAMPFMEAPPPEQGVAGVVAQGLGGVLGVIGAPQMIIDTAFASLTAPIAKLFPAMPAITLLGLHLGLPHAHSHPPSLIPPAPPVPLPSIGMLVGSGAVTVLLGGLPAARAGDIGISVTCGSLAPPFEVFTGSSNVFIGGARAARMLDFTKHCNPTSMGAFSIAMSAAGVVAGAAGAAATGSIPAAAQAAADAAVLAIRLLCGKDPGIPPGTGTLVGPPVPNVLIGGFPCPPIGEMAVGGLLKALGKAVRALKSRSSRKGNGRCADGSHPIYLVTGENFDSFDDFVSGDLFEWRRHYTSARFRTDSPVGLGFRHFYQRALSVRLHRAIFTDWDGEQIAFDRFERGSDTTRSDGYVLKRIARGHYRLSFRNEPTMTFKGAEFDGALPLVSFSTPTQELSFTYDGVGRLIEALDHQLKTGVRRRYSFDYDGMGHIVRLVERATLGGEMQERSESAIRAQYTYAEASNLLFAKDALGGTWSYEYDAFGRLRKQSDPRGYSFAFQYDVHGRCIEAAGQDGLFWGKAEYHPEERFTRFTEGDNATWEYHYDRDGFVTKIVDPYGGEKVRIRDGDGKLAREVDSGGRELTWLYDADGAHYARMDRFGNIYPPETEMPNLENPFARTLPNTAQARFFSGAIDVSPKAMLTNEASWQALAPIQFLDEARDFVGRAVETMWYGQQPGPLETHTERDAMNRKTTETDALGRTQEWTYDASGNVVAIRDRDGAVSTNGIVSWNLVGLRKDPLGNTMRYQFSPLQQIVGVVDPLGNDAKFEYDLKNRLTRVHQCGLLLEEYIYDGGDHFIEKRDGAGQTIFRNQIHENHMVSVRHLASGGYHRYDYDDRGWITEASTDKHEVRLSYSGSRVPQCDSWDKKGIEMTSGAAGWHAVVLDRFTLSATSKSAEDWTDTIEIEDAAGRRTRLHHDDLGLVRRDCGNGTVEMLQFDPDGRLVMRLAQRAKEGEAPRWRVSYRYTREGDLIGISDNLRGDTFYEVDRAHRLVGMTDPNGERTTYLHDAANNLHINPDKAELLIGQNNQLMGWGNVFFEYNDRNHLSACRLDNGATLRYSYDSFDMLVAIERTENSGTSAVVWKAAYDAIGRRLWTETQKGRHRFYWQGDRLTAEVFPNGRLRIYVYAGETALVPLSFIDYESEDAAPESGRTHHVFSDPVGMPLCIEDEKGETVWEAVRIDPFGRLEVSCEATITYNLRWPGHYFDEQTGLHYNRYRYYSPDLGRYLQTDPLGYGGSPVNLYAYCANPLVNVDVLGLADNGCGGGGKNGNTNDNSSDVDGKKQTTNSDDLLSQYNKRVQDTDGYSHLREISDGSDLRAIAKQTGLTEAEVAQAKQHLMHDEHLLVDGETGEVYIGRFEPFEDIADTWGKMARGEEVTPEESAFMKKLIRHEGRESEIMKTEQQSLNEAFNNGELEQKLRIKLQELGVDERNIDVMMSMENKPVTPYRYAHYVAHYEGFPN